ncbi:MULTISPECIES: YdaU family protein [unclassified Rhizobium]|uniref:YdaU family protein n=1 Tax=unclassified Rhizobium TaxID=2613769 RepID=UPI000715F524|nr:MULTISPECIES: DUF1376 domain-containing protein [unclassified Rhizobium]KQT03191.1 hypothetical protein ASG42_24585 [Rhizobium sp. Leaf391]KQU08414.1 hypothetical protein ASG68_22775 [Rhizobium sp. Leaf453]
MNPDYVPDFTHCVLPYVQWYQDDFVGGVRGMKAHEIGIYTMLLMEMYMRGRALDQSHDRLSRMCGADLRTFEKVLSQLIPDGKIVKLNCGYWNERCENAFRSRAKMQEQLSIASRQSWQKRRKNNGPDMPLHSDCIADAKRNSEAQNIIKETPKGVSKKRASRLSPDWQCPDDWIDEAVKAGLKRDKAVSESVRMRDWSLSSTNGKKIDWRAAWRNWYKDKLEKLPTGNGRGADGHLTNDFLFGGR